MILSKYEPLFYSRLKKNVRTSNILIPQPEVMMKHRKPTWLENHPQSCVALEKIHCVKISKRFRTITKRWRPHSSKKQPRLQMEAERPQASLKCAIRPTKGKYFFRSIVAFAPRFCNIPMRTANFSIVVLTEINFTKQNALSTGRWVECFKNMIEHTHFKKKKLKKFW